MHHMPPVLMVLPAATTPWVIEAMFVHRGNLMAALTHLLRPTTSLKVAVRLVSAPQAFLDAEHSNMAQLAEQLGSLMTVNDSLEMVRPVIQEDQTQPGPSQ